MLEVDEDEVEIIDEYLGDMIEKIIVNYEYDINFDDDYEEILRHIYRSLVRAWFKEEPSLKAFEEKLKKTRRRYPRKLEIVLSYLVSTYLQKRQRAYPRFSRENDR